MIQYEYDNLLGRHIIGQAPHLRVSFHPEHVLVQPVDENGEPVASAIEVVGYWKCDETTEHMTHKFVCDNFVLYGEGQ